jgi:hypothetical protein
MSEDTSRGLASDPVARDRVMQATGPVDSVTASPEELDGPYVPSPGEWLEGVRHALRDRAELMEAHATAVAELLTGGGKGE